MVAGQYLCERRGHLPGDHQSRFRQGGMFVGRRSMAEAGIVAFERWAKSVKDHESGLPHENGWCTISSPAEVCSAVPRVCCPKELWKVKCGEAQFLCGEVKHGQWRWLKVLKHICIYLYYVLCNYFQMFSGKVADPVKRNLDQPWSTFV